MEEMRLKARAKVNLGLDVLRKREDGYHEVRMIMQTIQLYDKLKITRIREPQIQVRTNLHFLPTNEDNLAYRAAKLLLDEFHAKDGVQIELNKYIPVAAGLAGGSSDAAAVLVGVNRIFGFHLSQRELMERAARLGADVPYCVMRGTALAEGIGEKLTPLPPMPDCAILVAKPKIFVSTKHVYENLKADQISQHPDIDGQIEALRKGDLKALAERMGNVLETVTIPEYPIIGQIKESMKKCGALNAMMSGSGPTVFGLFTDREKAREAYDALKQELDSRQIYLLS